MNKHYRYILAAIAFASSLNVSATTIDFNALTETGLFSRGNHYEEDGFQLDALVSISNGLYSIGSGNIRYTGTTSFLNNNGNGVTQLSKIDGGAFTFNSIDLDSLNGSYSVSISFIADLLGGGTATQTFTTDSVFPSLQTFSFGNIFQNVTAVRWTQVADYHSFDNIVVDSQTTVPEPSIMALLGLGLAGMRLVRRKAA